jgi:CHAD domain-containing protein
VNAPTKAPESRTAALLESRVKRVFRELPGALGGEEEPVHQVRVAGRRLRVALPLLARKGKGRHVRRALKVLRQLTREVGSGRDLDVFRGLLEDRLATEASRTPEQRALLSRLRTARATVRAQAAEAILDLDIDGLRRNLRQVLQQGAADPTTVLARIVVLREDEAAALLRGFSQIGERYLPQALHALRRRARRLRYAAEVEDALRGEVSRAPVLWKRLQDGIGLLHDHHQLAAWLGEQSRLAAERGNAPVARAARRERRLFLSDCRRLHSGFLATRPADLALRALEAMGRGRRRARPPTAAREGA